MIRKRCNNDNTQDGQQIGRSAGRDSALGDLTADVSEQGGGGISLPVGEFSGEALGSPYPPSGLCGLAHPSHPHGPLAAEVCLFYALNTNWF